MDRLEQLLAEKFGWDCRSLGDDALPDAARNQPRHSAADLQSLVEALVVPETWFFRDTAPFDFLARQARAAWPGKPRLRILSAPCSSGEEPYSIVLTLLAAGWPAAALLVDAVDVSARLLDAARAGIYAERALRETNAERRGFFAPAGPGRWAVPAPVKNCVRFHQANIMDLDACTDLDGPYQAVFCRNLLIYQHPAARRHVAEQLTRRLSPDGILFVGHAEMLPLFDEHFQPAHCRGAFAYQRRPPRVTAAHAPAVPPSPASRHPRFPIPAAVPAAASLAPSPPVPLAPPPLAEVRRLADAGRLEEAARLCETALGMQPLCAEAHLLHGVILAAGGRLPDAEAALQKAVYLDAQCREALAHLALLLDRRGDAAGAARLRRRLAQLPEGNKY